MANIPLVAANAEQKANLAILGKTPFRVIRARSARSRKYRTIFLLSGLDGKALNSATILPLTDAKLLALGAVDRQPSFWLPSVKLTHAKQLKLALMGLIPRGQPT